MQHCHELFYFLPFAEKDLLLFLPWQFFLIKIMAIFLASTHSDFFSSILFFIFYLSGQYYFGPFKKIRVWQNLAYIIHSEKWAFLVTIKFGQTGFFLFNVKKGLG